MDRAPDDSLELIEKWLQYQKSLPNAGANLTTEEGFFLVTEAGEPIVLETPENPLKEAAVMPEPEERPAPVPGPVPAAVPPNPPDLPPPGPGDGGGGNGDMGGRLSAVEHRMTGVETRMSGVEAHLGALEASVTKLKGRVELYGLIGTAAGVLAAIAVGIGTWQLSELRESIAGRTEVLKQEFENVRKEAENRDKALRLDVREEQIKSDAEQDATNRRLDRILERLPQR